MEQSKKLEDLSNQNRLQLTHNDRLFFTKYLYRLTIELYAYKYPQLMYVETIDANAFTVDSERKINFINSMRLYSYKHEDRVRLEHKTLMYYTSDIKRLEDVIKYVNRLNEKGDDDIDPLLLCLEIKHFPGTLQERNVQFRKKRLPYGKFKFQILCNRMDQFEHEDWKKWALQYPNDVKVPKSKYERRWGTWAGESIGYVSTDKMLNLITFKLGPKINKIIKYKIKGT